MKNVFDIIAREIYGLLAKSAWPMQEPKPYGAFHLCFMLLGFALCGALAWRLRNLGKKQLGRIIFGCGVFLLLSELYKQSFYCVYLWDGSYDWGIFPFHLCSVPMYLGIIAPLLRPGRLQKAMYAFMGSFNLLGGGIAFFEPSGLLHGYWTLTLHALIWHMLLVFMGLLLCFSGMAGESRGDFKAALAMFFAMSLLAFALYLAFRDISQGALNCFFIGPAVSSIIVFRAIGESLGWYISSALYIPCLCLGSYAVFWLCGLKLGNFGKKRIKG